MMAATAFGQVEKPSDTLMSRLGLEAIERKMPSIFHLARKKTPAEQLAYAQSEEARDALRGARRGYDAIVHEWGNSPEAIEAQLGVARLCERGNMMRRAFQEYQYAITHYSGHFPYEAIVEKQYAIANLLRSGLSGRMWFGGGASQDEVIDMFQIIVDNAPAWTNAPACMLYIGLTHEAGRNLAEAVTAYEALATRYPRSDEAVTGLYRAALCRYTLSSASPRDERLLRNAIAAVRFFLDTHPDHAEAPTLQGYHDELTLRLARMAYDRAAFYDTVRQRPEAAIVAYQEFLRLFPDAPHAEQAQARLDELTGGYDE